MNVSRVFLFLVVLTFVSRGLAAEPKELTEVLARFQEEMSSLDRPLVEFRSKYRGYAEKQKEAYRKAGELEAMLAIEEELKWLEGLPIKKVTSAAAESESERPLSSFSELKKLQEIFRKQWTALQLDRQKRKVALYRSFRRRRTNWLSNGRWTIELRTQNWLWQSRKHSEFSSRIWWQS